MTDMTAAGYREQLIVQTLMIAALAVFFFWTFDARMAGSAAYGGAAAIGNAGLLHLRRRQMERGAVLDASGTLVRLYRVALERFLLVAGLFLVGMGWLGLDGLAVIVGFIVGQLGLISPGFKK